MTRGGREFQSERTPLAVLGMTDPRRYRLVEWSASGPNWTLCTVEGAAELGVPAQPDDDLIVLHPPGIERSTLEGWARPLREAGREVVIGEGAKR